MSRERTPPDIVRAVEQAAILRIVAPTDKQLQAQFPNLSRSTIFRIMRGVRLRLQAAVPMKQLSQSRKK